jgi:predicted branched-subunit amino acid permease
VTAHRRGAPASRKISPMQSFRALAAHPQFRLGARDMAQVSLGVAAWGLVTGVAMVKGGLSVPLALLMSLTVYAGSAQLATLPLIVVGAPVWVIWATALCVNLRFVIFSAQLRPYFKHMPLRWRVFVGYLTGDLTYVLFIKRYPVPGDRDPAVAYFVGNAGTNWLSWQVPSIAGIFLAHAVPTSWGLGFAGVLALLGLGYSLMSDRSTVVSATVAGTAAVAAFSLPLRLHIVVAIAAGVCVGLLMDRAARTESPR